MQFEHGATPLRFTSRIREDPPCPTGRSSRATRDRAARRPPEARRRSRSRSSRRPRRQ
ncbi:hypothetical protein D187_001957 [Cystobacter fuscus DSM 2262]|uniref:Uncharacterized protein n=1 Tax=Cystobacter fuscus (strain ATCC 25194 / DSM 2262 / NBRC 100088 / M29) TaxID=1242864 RepID=S9P7P7_CYSF2|nr:hypothetical protein D187_001957 [Cystobacter fuscus DSM 2262]